MTIVKHDKRGGVEVVIIEQARLVDDFTLREVQGVIDELLENPTAKNLLLDFQLVDVMSSEGLGMLIKVRKTCAKKGISLRLCSFRPALAQSIHLTGMDELFEIHDDVAQAIAAFQKGQGGR